MARYPIGLQDFKGLQQNGYIYVDKTNYIAKLLEIGKYFFLSRPRRFGKSLFISTLEYFFKGEKDLFKGLAIESYDWEWLKYPVIHIDLNGANYAEEAALNQRLSFSLYENEKALSLPDNEILSNDERFRNLIIQAHDKTGLPVVVLIDEYEKPIVDNLDRPALLEKNRDILGGFYSVLKSSDKYLKFVFLTGVTKLGQMNVFSGLNNIKDISLNSNFGAVCGITKEELMKSFKEGIENLAEKNDINYEEALQLLKEKYDGYHFSRNCPDIYNPYSILNALADSQLSPYWSYTGTPTLLVKLVQQKNYNLEDFEGIRASEENLIGIDKQFDDPVTLFYQTGYLTIKSYDKELGEYILGYPNKEVEKAFFSFVLPFYYKKQTQASDSLINNLNRCLLYGEANKAMQYLEDFSAGISYDLIPIPEVERHFQSMIYLVVKIVSSAAITIVPEWKTSDGRIDLLIQTSRFVYIVEIKINASPQKALSQIKEKEYGKQFNGSTKEVFLIGMNFSTGKKRIDGFIVEKL